MAAKHARIDSDVVRIVDNWRKQEQVRGLRQTFNAAVNNLIRVLANGRKGAPKHD